MQTILVTGANRGIGLALVQRFRERGDRVIAACRSTSPELDATGARVEAGLEEADVRAMLTGDDYVAEFHADLDVRRQRLFDRYEELVFGDFSRSADLLANMQRGNPPPAEHATSYTLFLKEMTDVVDLTSAAVSQKDYTMDLGFQNAGAGVHLTLQTIAKYTGIVALEHARQGAVVDDRLVFLVEQVLDTPA